MTEGGTGPGRVERRGADPVANAVDAAARSRGDEDRLARERRATRLVLASFGVSVVTGFALLVVYALGGQTQVEGLLLTACLGGIGVGIVFWGQRLMPTPIKIEPRGSLASDPSTVEGFEETLAEEAGFSRRKLLLAGLGAAFAALGAAIAIPVLSLGPAPGRSLFTTSWRPGRRLATAGAGPIRAADIPTDGVVTVFPDGDVSDPNAATLLIHVQQDEFAAFSKICTHAGCAVGLYRATQHTLICPCHQSEFDVLDDARPINGPAARPLPRLPIRREADGTFTALGDFPEPVGPSFWNVHS